MQRYYEKQLLQYNSCTKWICQETPAEFTIKGVLEHRAPGQDWCRKFAHMHMCILRAFAPMSLANLATQPACVEQQVVDCSRKQSVSWCATLRPPTAMVLLLTTTRLLIVS